MPNTFCAATRRDRKPADMHPFRLKNGDYYPLGYDWNCVVMTADKFFPKNC